MGETPSTIEIGDDRRSALGDRESFAVYARPYIDQRYPSIYHAINAQV